MDAEEIFITLPSSASMKTYPNNTLSHYFTELSTTLHIDRQKYEVALGEFLLNGYICNIEKDRHIFTVLMAKEEFQKENKEKKHTKLYSKAEAEGFFAYVPGTDRRTPVEYAYVYIEQGEPYPILYVEGKPYYYRKIGIPRGYYKNIKQLIDTINQELERKSITNHLKFLIKKTEKENVSVAFIELLSVYGLNLNDPSKILIYQSSYMDNALTKWVNNNSNNKLQFVLDFNRLVSPPKLAYVYCNIVEHQIVGDTRAQLLRVVHIKENSGSENVIYNTPHFMNLALDEINTIEIYIRTAEGDPLPFDEGSLVLTLHLRRKKE